MKDIYNVIRSAAIVDSLPMAIDLSFPPPANGHAGHESGNGQWVDLRDAVVFSSLPSVEQLNGRTSKTEIALDVYSDEFLASVTVANIEEAADAPARARRIRILRQPTTQVKAASPNERDEDEKWTLPRDQNPYPTEDGTFWLFDEAYLAAAAMGKGNEFIRTSSEVVPDLEPLPLHASPRQIVEDPSAYDAAVEKFRVLYDQPSKYTPDDFPRPVTPLYLRKVETATPEPTPEEPKTPSSFSFRSLFGRLGIRRSTVAPVPLISE